jgi:Lon protease-like protein
MDEFLISLSDLPDEFPVFPLTGALLLPGGRLPLNIFEPRYLAMVEDALAAGRMFGMVQPDKRLARGDNGPGLYRTGCLGRLSSFSETDDGRYLITLTGLIRYTIIEEVEPQRGYRRVRATYNAFNNDLSESDPDNQPEVDMDRARLMGALRRYFTHAGVEANWDAIETMPDHALVVTLCMACPFDAEEKQALLEARDPTQRARALLALLEINAFDSGTDDDSKAS